MWMKVQILSPAMQDGEEAGLHAQAFGVGGNREQSLSGGAEQEVINEGFVVESDGLDGFRESKYDVEVVRTRTHGGVAGVGG